MSDFISASTFAEGNDGTTAVHMIGNAHLDPVWLWRWQEGYAEIKATFRSALDRMREFPEFKFTSACASYYKWVEENAPDMFAEIKARVAEGRWTVAGGWWVQPDCNLPAGESFARHSLYGQRYFLKKFGTIASVGYNVDSFGHHAMLPQLLRLSGMDNYVFMRPEEREKPMAANLFWWESADGSRVLAYRIPHLYSTHWTEPALPKMRLVAEIATAEGTDQMCFYGVGNHGGGPTIANLREIRAAQEEMGEDRIACSSPNVYFERMRARLRMTGPKTSLPLVTGDLQHHARGCYSAHAETKALNRRAEQRLLFAEKFAAMAQLLLGVPCDSDLLQAAWQQVMFNQFHDIIGGCSIKEAYDDSRESYGHALHAGATVLNAALQRISWAVDTHRDEVEALNRNQHWRFWETGDLGTPVVVFNPLPWEATVPLQLPQRLRSVANDAGEPLEIQQVRASRTYTGDNYDTLTIVQIPAMGYRVYWMYMYQDKKAGATAPPDSGDSPLTATATAMENRFVRVEIEPHTGYIKRLFDKRGGVEALNGSGAVPVVIDEYDSDTWAHGIDRFCREAGKFADAEVGLIEDGPLRSTLRITSRYGQSVLRQDVTLLRDSPDIHVKVKLDWRERHKMLKLSFPLRIEHPRAVYEIPYGHIERPVNGEEEPGQMWVDVTGVLPEDGSRAYGLALLNDSKYSFSVQDADLRMTVARGAVFAELETERVERWAEYMDQGMQEFAYTLAPHEGGWQDAGIVRKALELNVPPTYVVETYHHGPLPGSFCGMRVSPEQVVAAVLKRAEDGGGYVVRCYESAGRETEATLEIVALGRKWRALFGRCEIKTFFVPDDAGLPIRETNLLEIEIQPEGYRSKVKIDLTEDA